MTTQNHVRSVPDCWYVAASEPLTPGVTAAYVYSTDSYQASAAFPENTLSSFAQAIKDGSQGIESDVHITSDDVIVMFHDTTLDRTTDSKGPINQRPYYGENGIEHVRTLKQPAQQIPTFEQLCELLMQPENRHIVLNIDIKPNNDPERLFRIMHTVVSKFPEYETQLAPRLILGLWHPKFIQPAKEHVPTLTRAHIGASPADAIKYFWQDCSAFSLRFTSLINFEGQAFLKKAREDKKDVMVWTVNRKDEMIEAAKWGVKAILTDHTDVLHQLRADLQGTCVTSHAADFDGVCAKNMVPLFSWTNIRYYTPSVWVYSHYSRSEVEQHAGSTYAGLPKAIAT